jgi:hypothetical protein
MARIRSVKPEFWSSEQVMECSPMARLMFIGLWNFCDDAGNHVASAKTIKAEIFPGDDISSVDVQGLLDELSSNGLIAFYTSDSKEFLHVTGWKKHQKIDKPTYKHPPFSADARRALDEPSPPEWNGGEGKGGEQSSLRSDSQPPDDAVDLLPDAPQAATVHPHPGGKTAEIVLAAYHQLLPSCQRIVVLNPKRQRRVLAADKLARQLCRQLGWEYDAAAFWQAYFEQCAADPWLRGEVPNPNNPRWKQNLDVLLAEDRFAQIMDQAVTALGDAA